MCPQTHPLVILGGGALATGRGKGKGRLAPTLYSEQRFHPLSQERTGLVFQWEERNGLHSHPAFMLCAFSSY